MRRAARRWGRGLALVGLLAAAAARAQTVPVVPPVPVPGAAVPAPVVAPAASPRLDSLKTPRPTFVADTARRVVVVNAAEPSPDVTRPRALRIGAAIVVLTLTTLLLYNVRSR